MHNLQLFFVPFPKQSSIFITYQKQEQMQKEYL